MQSVLGDRLRTSLVPLRARHRTYRARRQITVAASGETTAFPSQPESDNPRQVLETALKKAIQVEDYATAARLKKQISEILAEDPVSVLSEQLKAAVSREDYKEAAVLRDKLKELEAQQSQQQEQESTPEDRGDLPPNQSNTSTSGIRVKVESHYIPSQSLPAAKQYMFTYTVTIINESKAAVQLKNRHWKIVDGNGEVRHVRGPGVIGEQPVLGPGKHFEYSSASAIPTPKGSMEGEYEMVVLNEDGVWGDMLEVKIGRFGLIATP